MKKILIAGIFVVGSIVAYTRVSDAATDTAAPDFSEVIEWMHTVGLTKYDSVEEFRPLDSITR